MRAYQDCNHKHQVDLGVQCELYGLRHLEFFVFDTSLVLADALKNTNNLLLFEESSFHWCIGETEVCPDADKECDNTKHDEHNFPALDRCMLDVLET